MGYSFLKKLHYRKLKLLTITSLNVTYIDVKVRYLRSLLIKANNQMLDAFSNVLGHARVKLTLALLVPITYVEIIGRQLIAKQFPKCRFMN